MLLSLSLISFETDISSTSLISLSDNPAFDAACKTIKKKHCNRPQKCLWISWNTDKWYNLVPQTMMQVQWCLCPLSRSFSTTPSTPVPPSCHPLSLFLELLQQIALQTGSLGEEPRWTEIPSLKTSQCFVQDWIIKWINWPATFRQTHLTPYFHYMAVFNIYR